MLMDVLRRWEAEGRKLGFTGVGVSFGFILRKRICVVELEKPTAFETDLEFQQVSSDLFEGLLLVGEKDAIRLAAMRYLLHPLAAKDVAQLCIFIQLSFSERNSGVSK